MDLKTALDGTPYRREPCNECPWQTERTPGQFPPERYRALAASAYDAAFTVFTCHKSSEARPVVCAGFLLRNSVHNLSCRLMGLAGGADCHSEVDLYPSYREMAVANGVAPDDPVLARCRTDNE